MRSTFLKWAGGKRRILKKIDTHIPKEINTYFEPFLGGGSMFFYIKQKYVPKKCVLSDINKDLIDSFKAVRDNPKKLISSLKYFKKKDSKEFFYNTRKKFNENKIFGVRRAAAFIYLNKTCFNGLWRVNSAGEFNVPYGKYKNPEIFNAENIFYASYLLKEVKILHQDYRKIIKIVKKGDLVYLDPCYDPLKKTSFANYTPKRFSELDRIELAKFIRFLNYKGVKIILNNNDIPPIRKLYSKFNIQEIFVSRSINSDPLGRGKIKELIITN
ncbi:MAG: Dam family site-specific DNA-(adenine-N6)-methyltransferase [Candidatus Nanoarchaeia archaeon]|nr:Dam family site-specific DNA-(adenine-N6)-methyltransferase [Candidatus Nanoarchaeia archaeon]MDD5587811.1 Dam family site-specific DNA-(adenine-N6)-methyltransferase [Candidatus Nanoarchaeia archaeon]